MNEIQERAILWYSNLSWVKGIIEGAKQGDASMLNASNVNYVTETLEGLQKFLINSIIKVDENDRIQSS